jgi:hypothetical protein
MTAKTQAVFDAIVDEMGKSGERIAEGVSA